MNLDPFGDENGARRMPGYYLEAACSVPGESDVVRVCVAVNLLRT